VDLRFPEVEVMEDVKPFFKDLFSKGGVGRLIEKHVPNYKKVRPVLDVVTTLALVFMAWYVYSDTERFANASDCHVYWNVINASKQCATRGLLIRGDVCYYPLVETNYSQLILTGNYSIPTPVKPLTQKIVSTSQPKG